MQDNDVSTPPRFLFPRVRTHTACLWSECIWREEVLVNKREQHCEKHKVKADVKTLARESFDGLDALRVELKRVPLPASNTCCVVLIAAWLPQPEDKVVASVDLTLHAGDNREGILPEREDPTTYAIWSSSSESVSMSVFAIVITAVEKFAISFTTKPLTAVAEIALCNREPMLFLRHWIGILSGLQCGLPLIR